MHHAPLPNCHDGMGDLDFIEVLGEKETAQSSLNFMHDDILAPGVTIGEHMHHEDVEYYYILSGSGVMILDGVRHPVGPGDIAAVFPGGTHGLENTGKGDLRIIVISVQPG